MKLALLVMFLTHLGAVSSLPQPDDDDLILAYSLGFRCQHDTVHYTPSCEVGKI